MKEEVEEEDCNFREFVAGEEAREFVVGDEAFFIPVGCGG